MSLVHVLVVAVQFVFPVETILSTVLTAKLLTWELRSLGAVLSTMMSLEIAPLITYGVTVSLGAMEPSRAVVMSLVMTNEF